MLLPIFPSFVSLSTCHALPSHYQAQALKPVIKKVTDDFSQFLVTLRTAIDDGVRNNFTTISPDTKVLPSGVPPHIRESHAQSFVMYRALLQSCSVVKP